MFTCSFLLLFQGRLDSQSDEAGPSIYKFQEADAFNSQEDEQQDGGMLQERVATIDEETKQKILELSKQPNVYERLAQSIGEPLLFPVSLLVSRH